MVTDVVRRRGYLALGTRLKRIGEKLQADVQQLMDAHGVPMQAGQYPILAALDENGPSTINELVEALGVSQPGITRSVGQLEKKGILSVERDTEDQRKKVVTMTKAGRAMIEDAKAQLWPKITGCLEEICADETGPLLNQLDRLEDILLEKSLYRRIMETKEAENDGSSHTRPTDLEHT